MGTAFDETVLQTTLQHLQDAIATYQHALSPTNRALPTSVKALIQTELESLTALGPKLSDRRFTIAALGLVSRGKSAVLNALLGQEAFATGPINGVTQWPQTVIWSPDHAEGVPGQSNPTNLTIELIDTPGFDEVAGQTRAEMAQQIAQQADLLLFVVAGDITRTEYQALEELLVLQKPLILVFNKIDLYPAPAREAVLQKLQAVLQIKTTLDLENVVQVTAEPMPLQTRVEHADGTVAQEWEQPTPQIAPLRDRLRQILTTEAPQILALNCLQRLSQSRQQIAGKTIAVYQQKDLPNQTRLMQIKAALIGLNPLGWLDCIVSAGFDLALVRSRSRLYQLPMTRHEVNVIWQTVAVNAALLLGTEALLQGLLNIGSEGGSVWTALTGYGTSAIAQGIVALYGSNLLAKKTNTYLKNGCTWGEDGTDTLIEAITQQAEPSP
ncbi:MAG: GTP-binding protein [Cyanobacteria bacterium P01_H01_bin.121]